MSDESLGTSMEQFEVLTASIQDHQIPGFLTRKLMPLMPYSLPLYRRCQFHLKDVSNAHHETENKHDTNVGRAEVWIALARSRDEASPSNRSDWFESWLRTESSPVDENTGRNGRESDEQWLATHINLTYPGETQVWTFGSWETTFRSASLKTQDKIQTQSETHKALFRTLFVHLRNEHIPHISHEPPQRWLNLLASGKLVSTPYNRGKVLFGCMSEALWPYLEDDVVCNNSPTKSEIAKSTSSNKSKLSCIARQESSYLKYLLPLSEKRAVASPPSGFHFAPLSRSQLQVMLDRSSIPRTIELLESLVNIGLIPDGPVSDSKDSSDPIAWGLLGKDASISSLHTEPDYRGKGLAEYVTKELIRMMDATFHCRYYLRDHDSNSVIDDQVAYTHTDVSENNIASRRVFEKLGGTVGWRTAWIEVMVGEQ